MSKFQQLIEARKKYDELIKTEGKAAIIEGVKDLFEKTNGLVTAIRWRQYTPHFNDGDPCEFGVGEVCFRLSTQEPNSDSDQDDSEYGDGYLSLWDNGITGIAGLKGTLKEFSASLNEIEDALKIAFGDHVMVTATVNKIDIEEYEHD